LLGVLRPELIPVAEIVVVLPAGGDATVDNIEHDEVSVESVLPLRCRLLWCRPITGQRSWPTRRFSCHAMEPRFVLEARPSSIASWRTFDASSCRRHRGAR
jgi:hypothetical protein